VGKRQVSKTPNKKKQKDMAGGGKEERKTRQVPWGLVSIVLICLVGVIAYSNSFDCSFHFDDTPNIEENIAIRNLSNIKAWWNFQPSRPIGFLSFALDYHFHRLDVWGYHLVNLAIHIANAVLVWWLVMLTMSTPVMRSQPVSRHKMSMAIFAALLFVSHPLATQSVTYIVQRLASLATLFYLLSLALYVKGRLWEGNRGTPVYVYYAGSILCAVLGMLTKEIVFTLPFALVLYEFSFIKTDAWKIDLKNRGIQIPVIILGIFVALFFLNFSFRIFNTIPPLLVQGYDYPITAWEYLLTQFSVILTYIRLFILPLNQNLDYNHPVYHSLFEWHTLFGLLSLAGIFVAGILLFRRYRLISFGIIWFFLTLSVESSIIPISQNVIFEHRTYLPGLGFFLVVAGVVFYFLWDRYRQVAWGILLLLVLTNTVLTYERNKVWRTDYTLWGDCIKKSPNKARPLSNYGNALLDMGNASEALTYYNRAVELNPHFYTAYGNRGNAKIKLGDYKDAVRDCEEALRINPYYSEAHCNLANALALQGKMGEAIVHLKEAIKVKPESADYHYNLGNVLAHQGKAGEAITHFQEAIKLKPDFADAENNLGNTLEDEGRLDEAIGHYAEALRINPNLADSYNNMGLALTKQGRLDEAIRNFLKALEINPAHAAVHYSLGTVLASQGKLDEAIYHFRECIRIKPDYAKAYNNLGNALLSQGKIGEAIDNFRQALRLKPDYAMAQKNLNDALAQRRKTR
jgi:tetratricopeptide (TPR) repeat protein